MRQNSSVFMLVIGIALGAVLVGLLVPYVRADKVPAEVTADSGSTSAGDGGGDQPSTGGGGRQPSTGGGGAMVSPTHGPAPVTATHHGGAPAATQTATGHATAPASGAPQGFATDVGLTKTSIKLGIGIIDIGAASSLGYSFDLGNQQARWQALVNQQNAKGGIDGRKIVPDYESVNLVTDPDAAAQAACVHWTQDEKDFSVLMSTEFPTSGIVCVTGNGATPFITSDMQDQSYYANGRLITLESTQNRALADEVNYLASSHALDGRKIGIVSGDGTDTVAVDDTLVPMLRKLGHAPSDVEVIGPTDVERIPIAISDFKAKGVSLVIFACNPGLVGPFVQAANRSDFTPKWELSSFDSESTDSIDSYVPPSFNGTIGFAPDTLPLYNAGKPHTPSDSACLKTVGKVDPKVGPANGLESRSAALQVAIRECAIFDVWVAGAERAGRSLTRQTLISSIESLGSLKLPRMLGGSFGPNKDDYEDEVMKVVWRSSCGCWLPAPGSSLRRMS